MGEADLSGALRIFFAAKRTFTLAEIRTLVALPSPSTDSRVSVREVAEQLHFNGPSMSRTISLLVNDGLVTRDEDPDDRRLVVLARSASGEKLVRQALRAGNLIT